MADFLKARKQTTQVEEEGELEILGKNLAKFNEALAKCDAAADWDKWIYFPIKKTKILKYLTIIRVWVPIIFLLILSQGYLFLWVAFEAHSIPIILVSVSMNTLNFLELCLIANLKIRSLPQVLYSLFLRACSALFIDTRFLNLNYLHGFTW